MCGLFHSSATLAYGLESFVDVFSSVMVLWRFKSTMAQINMRASMDQMEQQEQFARRLERRAGVGISFTFVAIACIVGGQACAHMTTSHAPSQDAALLVLAITSVFLLAALGIVKWHISTRLNSEVLKKDAICSLAVAILSLGLAVSAGAYNASSSVWWLDAVVALITAAFLLVYGGKTLFFSGLRWWQISFWKDDKASTEEHL